jgi:putative salt-induced outer membrane protein YdiY
MIHKLTCAFIAATLATLSAKADTVTTKDGSTLHGTITLIDKGEIHIDTKYAGQLTLKQDEVVTFETEAPVVVRLESGTKMTGPVIASSDGKLKIQSEDGVLETNTSKIAASWAPGAVDPEVDRNSRKWKYELAANLSGKKGNTDKFHLGTDLDVRLKGPDDELRFGLEYEQGDENDNKTDDRALGRIGYERFNQKNVGWYVHNALETDQISDIYMRSTTGGGASYRLINNDVQTLIVRSGLGYRFTDFESDDKDNDSSATFEAGLEHTYQYKDICYLENKLYYSPALDDFGNYRAIHDSSLKIPVGNGESFWIRMGIKNEYESQTSAEEKLDTSYYTKLIWSWK